jgi:uncharacterized membrane protein (DUF2068 family)
VTGPSHPSPPGTVKPQRLVPKLHYELLVCGLVGHALVGTDAAVLRPEDAIFARESADGQRWHRCLRCDSWLALAPPAAAARDVAPSREELALPLRGRALRDKIVLRLIAVDRALHFLVLGAIAVAIIVFAAHRATLRGPFYRLLADLQGGVDPSAHDRGHGLVHELRRLFSTDNGTLVKIGMVVGVYAVVEGIEAVGLWLQKRWAEYLTFIVTASLLPLEIYELAHKLSALKILAFVVNVAVVAYLLSAKRLFGIRGGAAAEHAERERDGGWPAVERATPAGGPGVPTSGSR